MTERKHTDFVGDEVARVTLSVLDRAEGAADEDPDASGEEDPEEDAPIIHELSRPGVEGAGVESRDGRAEVREVGATVGRRKSVRSIGRGRKDDEHSVGEDEEEEGEESEGNELNDQTGECDLGSDLCKVAFACRASRADGLNNEGNNVAPAAQRSE
jgi:hypothetical protein